MVIMSAAGFGEGLDIGIDRLDHQMDVEDFAGMRTQCLDHRRTDGQVGHEMAVHDIDMDIVGAGGIDGADLFPSRAKSADRYGGGNL